MDLLQRPLAITDVETTGLDAQIHEIIEIGLLVADQKTLKVLDQLEAKVKPLHLGTADRSALELNGYNEPGWTNALELKTAMEIYANKTRNAIFLAHNTTFDWSFIFEAFRKTGVRNSMDYHRIDLLTIAWSKARENKLPGLKRFNLDELCQYFGIPKEPLPHRAINGVQNELAVLKQLIRIDPN